MSILWIKDSHKQGGSSSQTIVVTPDRLDEGNFKTVAYEKHLPKKLSTDTLLLVKENGDLYIGTGSGIKKITGQIKVDPGNNGQTVDLSEYLKTKNADEKYATKTELSQIQSGAQGKSAYQIAVEKGFVGDEQAWLASLKGEKGADGTTPDMSQYATKEDLSHVQAGEKGADGKSAYQIAVEKGYIGDETAWLASLKGEKGADGVSPDMSFYATKEDLTHVTGAKGEDGAPGKSAYELAQEAGYIGSKEYWLASLKGEKGIDGVSGANGKSAYQIAEEIHGTYKGGEQEWLDSLVGRSAYQIAVEHGYSENETEWLKSLKGADGTTPDMSQYATKSDLTNVGAGKSAYDIAKEEGFTGSKTEWLASLKGNEGIPGANGLPGEPGKSAYQVAVDKGFIGDEQTWLNSLKGQNGSPGENGAAGESAYQIAQRVKSFKGTEEDWLNSLKGQDGITPSTENFVQKNELKQYVTLKKFTELEKAFNELKEKVEAAHHSP